MNMSRGVIRISSSASCGPQSPCRCSRSIQSLNSSAVQNDSGDPSLEEPGVEGKRWIRTEQGVSLRRI